MLRPCINHASANLDLSIDEQFKRFHEAGFKCIDFNFDIFLTSAQINSGEFSDLYRLDTKEFCEYFKQYKEVFEKYDLEITQAHAPFQLYVDGRDDLNEFCYEAVEKTIAASSYLGCKYLVVHPLRLDFEHDRDYERKVNFEYFERFIPASKKYGVVICLENMFGSISRHVTEGVCSDCTEVVNYIDKLNEKAGDEYFGFCFDVGHMNLLGKNLKESLKTLGHRVKLLHIHDNDAIQDHHSIPFSFTRTWGQAYVTDWKGFIEGLRIIGYRGELDFEVGTGCKLLPDDLKVAGYKYVYAIGEYFAKEILK